MRREVNLQAFHQKIARNKSTFKRFLSEIEKNTPRKLDKAVEVIEQDLWKEVDCLTCANCCKVMTPTYTPADIKRISNHLGMKPKAFKEKWLEFDKKSGDWMNVSRPCQFLDNTTNMCSIYEVRPADCAGFPHLSKKKMKEYIHVHKQNIEYCPATYKMVEKMIVGLDDVLNVLK